MINNADQTVNRDGRIISNQILACSYSPNSCSELIFQRHRCLFVCPHSANITKNPVYTTFFFQKECQLEHRKIPRFSGGLSCISKKSRKIPIIEEGWNLSPEPANSFSKRHALAFIFCFVGRDFFRGNIRAS